METVICIVLFVIALIVLPPVERTEPEPEKIIVEHHIIHEKDKKGQDYPEREKAEPPITDLIQESAE